MTMNVEFNNNFLVKAPFEWGCYQISLFFEKYRKYDLAPIEWRLYSKVVSGS
jgi:hypothetical protein